MLIGTLAVYPRFETSRSAEVASEWGPIRQRQSQNQAGSSPPILVSLLDPVMLATWRFLGILCTRSLLSWLVYVKLIPARVIQEEETAEKRPTPIGLRSIFLIDG